MVESAFYGKKFCWSFRREASIFIEFLRKFQCKRADTIFWHTNDHFAHTHTAHMHPQQKTSHSLMRPRSQKSTDSRRWLWRCVAPLKTVAMPKKWHLRARLHLFFAAMCRKWYLASLLLGENGAWSRLGRVDMDADEALQVFFDEEDCANVPIARFSVWLRSAWERRCRAHRWLGRLSFLPWRGNRQLRRGNLYGGSGQPSADGESSSESEI